jgi:inorganic pyrophosphatase
MSTLNLDEVFLHKKGVMGTPDYSIYMTIATKTNSLISIDSTRDTNQEPSYISSINDVHLFPNASDLNSDDDDSTDSTDSINYDDISSENSNGNNDNNNNNDDNNDDDDMIVDDNGDSNNNNNDYKINEKKYTEKKYKYSKDEKNEFKIDHFDFSDIDSTDSDSDDSDEVDYKKCVNMIVEIPQHTTEKIEIKTNIKYQPLMYDQTNGKIRKVTYHAKKSLRNGYPYHYGALPQTWENSLKIDKFIGKHGDDDPVDCFDISYIKTEPGKINTVRVLGCIAMIDDGKTDWKIIAINIKDRNASRYKNIIDIPVYIMEQIIDFLKHYKLPKITTFHEKMIWNADEAMQIIKTLHKEWIQHKKNINND